ncbi:MAG: HAMP domain-containing histidine kinase [Bacteroidales bacterium]|nr:HAMP domain-containing histidine kinase [Bacteroidales bacterium]
MKRAQRITNYIFFTATILIAIFALVFGIYEYRRELSFRVDILHSQLQLNNYHYVDGAGEEGIRVTVIDTMGNVLSDTEEDDVSHMGNHIGREEMWKALQSGSGYAIKRASETNGEKYFYSATRFGDKIVRSSVPYSAELTSSLEHDYTFFYYTASILALIATAIYFRHRYVNSEQEKQRIKRQLTENAAHELKTPAATIEGYLETLAENPDMPEDKRQEFIMRCHAQSRRMSRLLGDMSTLTRLDEAEIARPQTPIDAAVIIRQIEEETASQFAERNIELQIDIPESLPMTGDASLIYSLFRNIFSNAIAYATHATLFWVKATVTDGRYQFTFMDNGVGVQQEHLSRIFERFYRIDKGRSRQIGGTGLGLAIVKNIALQYGGSAYATTTAGGGLTIKVEVMKEG